VSLNIFLAAQQACSGLGCLIIEILKSHTKQTQSDSSGRGIGPSQRPLSDNTQHSQETDVHAQAGFEPAIQASERPQTYALDRAVTEIGV
jgi:hypothetical protein